jgi:hypothetical protein
VSLKYGGLVCRRLCGGDLKQEIRIDVWDEDVATKHDQIGLAKFPVSALLKKEAVKLLDYKEPPRANVKPGFVRAVEAAIYRRAKNREN